MIRAFIDLLIAIWKAIFKYKDDTNQEQQQHLQEHQEHLQDEYNKIDEQHPQKPDPTIQEVQDKLNDRF